MKFPLMLLIFGAVIQWSSGDESINVRHIQIIETLMDTEANPCLDFFQYTCGQWSDRLSFLIANKFYLEFVRYMNETRTSDMPDFVKKAYEFYSSCTVTTDTNEVNYLRWIEKEENIRWALLSSPEDVNVAFDWVRTLGIMRKYGFKDSLVEEGVSRKGGDPSKRIIDLKKPVKYDGTRLLKDYDLQFLDISTHLPINQHWAEINTFQDLLKKLNNIVDNSGKKLITVKELPLPWLKQYLSVILEQTTLDLNMELTIQNIAYFEALDALLKKYDQKFICRYLEIQFLEYLYAKVTPGSNKDCTQTLLSIFPIAMHWIYEQLHPELEEEIPKIQQMFSNIIRSVSTSLQKNVSVTEKLSSKLNNMQLKIGNLPRFDTIRVLNMFFAPLNLNQSDVFGNHLQLLKLYFQADHLRTTKSAEISDKNYFNEAEIFDWSFKAVRPYYLSDDNVIIVPPEFLRPPYYHPGYKNIFKYGSLGTDLTRYIMYGLDYFGTSDKDEQMTDAFSLRTSTQIVFSSFPDELNGHDYPMEDGALSMKKWFFINAAHNFCLYRGDNDVHEIFTHLPKFAETFECKLN